VIDSPRSRRLSETKPTACPWPFHDYTRAAVDDATATAVTTFIVVTIPSSPLLSSSLRSSKRDTWLCCPSVRFGFCTASPYWTRLGATVSSTLSLSHTHPHMHTHHTPSHSSLISDLSVTRTLTYTSVQRANH